MTVYHFSSTSLVVKWSHLQEEYFQGQPIGYKINCYPENLEREVKFWTVNYRTSTATLTNLTIYTMYTVKVSAVSSGGIGPANTMKARTGAEGTKVKKKKLSVLTFNAKRTTLRAFFALRKLEIDFSHKDSNSVILHEHTIVVFSDSLFF